VFAIRQLKIIRFNYLVRYYWGYLSSRKQSEFIIADVSKRTPIFEVDRFVFH